MTDEEIMAQVFAAFQEEQAEHRQAAGELLLELERHPEHPRRPSLLDQLFREAHSLKGGARAAGQVEVEQLAHRIEDVFSAVRKGSLQLTPDICDPIYAALDAVGEMMQQVSAGHTVDFAHYQPLLARLHAIVEGSSETSGNGHHVAGPTTGEPQAGEPSGPAVSEVSLPDQDRSVPELEAFAEQTEPRARSVSPEESGHASLASAAARAGLPQEDESSSVVPSNKSDVLREDVAGATVRVSTATLDSLLNEAGELMTCAIRARQHARDINGLSDLYGRWRRVWRQVRPAVARLQSRTFSLQPTVHHLDDRNHSIYAPAAIATDSDIAVLLDAFVQVNALMTELEQCLTLQSRQASEDHARLAAVTDRMHSQIRRTRMLPLTTLFNPLRLQLREMARSAKKQVMLDLDDGGAEADRQVLERLREVLIHLLRNALDHGVEPADVRVARGKSVTSVIKLCATVNGDHLTLVVEDDGAGLDLNAIKQRALSSGLASEADLARMNLTDLTDLIFLPGFSTRHTVNELSGRGVGLDIVRSHVERMHGRVAVQTVEGKGTTFILHVPLSLTSSHGLLIQSGASHYVLPLDAVQRIVQVDHQSIQLLEGQPALILDKRPLALVSLADLLGEVQRSAVSTNGSGAPQRLALILGSGERQVACLVDKVLGEQELVVHRLPAPLQRVRFVTGATILADGNVVPILDAVDVVRATIGTHRQLQIDPTPTAPHRTAHILVVDDSITTRTLEKNILEAAGYQVSLATDGHEALETLQRMADNGGCDLLLSDIDMPRINGFDLTRHVRLDAHFQHLPIVLVTSLDTPADRERGITAGADAYIVKRSFDQQVLLDTIAQLI